MSKIKVLVAIFISVIFVSGCSTAPSRMVYSSGFSFNNYDFVVIGKPNGAESSTSLYGMDVELSNLLESYNFKVIGGKQFKTFDLDKQKEVLFASMSLSASNDRIVMTVSFDDAVTGKTGASITKYTDGDIFDTDERTEAFEGVSERLIRAIERDKALNVSREEKK